MEMQEIHWVNPFELNLSPAQSVFEGTNMPALWLCRICIIIMSKSSNEVCRPFQSNLPIKIIVNLLINAINYFTLLLLHWTAHKTAWLRTWNNSSKLIRIFATPIFVFDPNCCRISNHSPCLPLLSKVVKKSKCEMSGSGRRKTLHATITKFLPGPVSHSPS